MTAHQKISEAEVPPVWSLDDLFSGREDPRIEAAFARAAEANGRLAEREGRLLAVRDEPDALGAALAEACGLYEAAVNALWSVGAYAGLAASVARNDPEWARFDADVRGRSADIAAQSVSFTLEINRLEDGELGAALAAAPAAARYAPWLRRVRLGKPFELSADLERVFVDRSAAVANWVRLYDETLGGLRARVGAENLTLDEALNRMSDPSPGRRRAAAAGLSRALGACAPTVGLCLNTLALEKRIEDRLRGHADPAEARHVANEADPGQVAAMEAAVVAAYPDLTHRYYRLKARVLGRRKLDHWDRNAPMPAAPRRDYGWREATDIVVGAFSDFSPEFGAIARGFVERPWIDARPRPGKSSGAYSHSVTSEHHPFVFLNFRGERRDILTLAHELGHAVHQSLAAPQGTLIAETPLTLAETASIFGEDLVFERLLAAAAPAERRGLLANRIEDALNTVVRQIAFHRFETRFHAARASGEVSNAEIGSIWLEVMAESLGPAVRLNPGYEHAWTYVSHFVRSPFYVYAYAFGRLLVEGLLEARSRAPEGFEGRYRALLAGGGAAPLDAALRPFGLDPADPAFWAAGCRRISAMIDAFEALV